MGLQISGLVNNLDTTSIVNQLMQVEANPQTLLKQQLGAVQADAAAYRALNTRFAALQTAAQAVTDATTWATTKATSSNSSVTASSDSTAVPGSITFTVQQLATNHSLMSSGAGWGSTTAAYGATSIDITVGTTKTSLAISGTNGNPPTLADAVATINGSALNLSAAPVQVAPGQYQLQITAKTSGAGGAFSLGPAADNAGYTLLTQGQDAKLNLGTTNTALVTSSSNTFSGLMQGTTITVSQQGATATVSVAKDPDAVAGKVQTLVDSANGLLDAISSYTDANSDSAVLKGDWTVRDYANRILDTVSSELTGGSLRSAGVEVTKDGHLQFTAATFTSKLASDPAGTQDLFTKTTTVNGVAQSVGLGARLVDLTKGATDTTTGTLVTLANSEDGQAKDLQDRIADWDIRLQMRKDSLTQQFTAMTTALQTLQNQGSWLTSQVNSLPTWNAKN